MTIFEMIQEWRKGCTCAEGFGTDKVDAYTCRDCTIALIEAIEEKAQPNDA